LYISEYICLQSPKLDILQPYHDKATSLRQNIEKQTENILSQGLLANSAGQVTGSLQIFVNLDVLEDKIVKILADTEKNIERDVKNSLEVKLQAQSASRGKKNPSKYSNAQPNKAFIIRRDSWKSSFTIHLKSRWTNVEQFGKPCL
jgi:hypothetical protein